MAATLDTKSWPRVLPDPSAPVAAREWSRPEIELAQARCTAILKSVHAVAVPESPLRDGECGTPAPMKLVSVGRNPQVALNPPPTVTCDMIASMHKWLEQDVQPLARKQLGAPIVRIDTMSSYSCRNAYGRAHGRLSEHGRANAVDISAFHTAKGLSTMVVADWGPTVRDIQTAAAKGTAPAIATQPAIAAPMPVPPRAVAVAPPSAVPSANATLGFQPHLPISIPGLTVDVSRDSGETSGGLRLTFPSKLGGPKTTNTAAAAMQLAAGKMDFLRAAHQQACKIFGTVLGPEANNAHRNHFHLDMAERRANTIICE